MKRNLLLAVIALALLTSACSKSDFDRAHTKAVAENPWGVRMDVVAINASRHLRVGEPLRFNESYIAIQAGQYHIEILDGWNEPSTSTTAYISDGKTTSVMQLDGKNGALLGGWICCNSRHVWLSLEATQLPYEYTTPPTYESWLGYKYRSIAMPSKPGKYQIYITSKRVFAKDEATTTYHGKGLAVTSDNIMDVEVAN